MPFADVRRLIARPPVVAGLDRMAPEVRAVVQELLQRFEARSEVALPIPQEAAALALWGADKPAVFLVWHREQGTLARSLEVLLAALSYERRTYEWDSRIWALARARPAVGLLNLGIAPWQWLRGELERASPAERNAAREIARRGSRSWHVRAALAFAFPDDADLWTSADDEELRHADVDDRASVTFGILAGTRRAELDLAKVSRGYELAAVVTGKTIVAALGAQAVPVLRLVQATTELAKQDRPEAWRALAELADKPAAWEPLSTIAPTEASIAALLPMFTTRRPRRLLGLSLAAGLLHELVVAAPDAAAELAAGDSPEARFATQVLDATGVRLPDDDTWTSPWLTATPASNRKPVASRPHTAAPKPIRFADKIHWGPGEHERFADYGSSRRDPKSDAGNDKTCRREAKFDKAFAVHLSWMTTEAALGTWKAIEPKRWYAKTGNLEQLLARFGLAELDSLLAYARCKPDTLAAFARVESPRVAPLMARGFALIKKQQAVGKAWLDKFPEAATIGLVGDTGADKKQRDANARALAHLTTTHPEIVEAVLAKVGGGTTAADVAAAAAPTLPPRPPKLPAFVDLDRLPRPIRNDREAALHGDALAEVVQVLKSTLPGTHPSLDALADRYTPESLARLAWSLFRQWLFADAPPKDKWALHAVGRFPDDDHARSLGRLARVWAPAGNSSRAQEAVEALAAMRTQAGLIEIHDIARQVQSKALRARAETVFSTVAESLGIAAAELADRLIPELTDRDLAFGACHVELDVRLVPRLVAPDGTVVDKPAADDAARFKELKKTCAAVARGQIARLEQMMAEAHRMPFSHFAEIYLMHSLIRHLSRSLLWGAYRHRELLFVFAIADDGPVDRAGAPLELPVDATYGVVHAAELAAGERTAWAEVLGDQPFEQLARPSFAVDSVDEVRAALRDHLGRTVQTTGLLELQRRGWRRGDSPQGGQYFTIERRGPGWSSEIAFEPGIYLGSPAEQPTQILRGVTFHAETRPPIAVISELQRDLAKLTVR